MQKRLYLAGSVFVVLCCVLGGECLAAEGFAIPKRVVGKIVAAAGNTSKLGQKIWGAAMVVGMCASLFSCGEDSLLYRDYGI